MCAYSFLDLRTLRSAAATGVPSQVHRSSLTLVYGAFAAHTLCLRSLRPATLLRKIVLPAADELLLSCTCPLVVLDGLLSGTMKPRLLLGGCLFAMRLLLVLECSEAIPKAPPQSPGQYFVTHSNILRRYDKLWRHSLRVDEIAVRLGADVA